MCMLSLGAGLVAGRGAAFDDRVYTDLSCGSPGDGVSHPVRVEPDGRFGCRLEGGVIGQPNHPEFDGGFSGKLGGGQDVMKYIELTDGDPGGWMALLRILRPLHGAGQGSHFQVTILCIVWLSLPRMGLGSARAPPSLPGT